MLRITSLLSCLLMFSLLRAQEMPRPVTIRVSLTPTTATSCDLSMTGWTIQSDYSKEGHKTIPLDAHGSGSLSFQLDKPRFVRLTYGDSDSNQIHVYTFFLSPGDSLLFKADQSQWPVNIQVSGRGAEDNQPMAGTLYAYPATFGLQTDTLPGEAVEVTGRQVHTGDSTLKAYVLQYHPSAAFIKAWAEYTAYMAPWGYFFYKENNKYGIGAAYERNKAEWQRVQDSIFAGHPLDNGEALVAPSYQALVENFLLRTKERLWEEARNHPVSFYREWYDTTEEAGAKMYQSDLQNRLKEKIILRYFKDPGVVEYAYALLMEEALAESNPNNLISIWQRFKERFPHSTYLPWFEQPIQAVMERQRRELTPQMVFAPDSGAHLHTWEDLLALVKGKTVLLDMWGTWCNPCREQLEQNTQALHDHFKGKGLDFVYVANYDEAHKEQWVKLIAYFDLEGTHVLAGRDLSKDIMNKVKGTGFPTYVIIKKDGTFALSKAGYPMDRNVLVRQLEEALDD
ncbi:TlpA family protein disulfide reductase [Dinghuibacter silviterrae]|uniref:Thiol-disulfide isomerase/thioredoxin n=1 Tax=Dinghuibacter silviterrae TaxID=1539049 RepID=A0A4V3GKY8_9BACT|nr:TlpA disulfide reductase family protein [Dinghuibacter silviterrae]TDW97492.1 thiol-disulfide isomerase/thioredoxin [Dinghuibacter silviterrae]